MSIGDPSKGQVFCYLKYRASFYEILELQNFPFDRQILHIDVSSFRPTKELTFAPFPRRRNKIFGMPISLWDIMSTEDPEKSTRICGGWCMPRSTVRDPQPTIVVPEKDLQTAADDLTYPRASFEIAVERRCEYYLWNVILVVWATVGMSYTIYSIDPADVADRMAITTTLLLTLVAFKFTFVADMPKKAYLTWMDKYLVVAFIIVVLQAAEVFWSAHLAKKHPDSPYLDLLEWWSQVGLYGSWTAFHAFLFFFYRLLYPSWEKVKKNQRLQVVL
mmetsp:Transcript_14277/g.38485  ORF Transcript_14277/g.38485 Transcript_14277/m.38485 type:complete len:275 (+) Transcript_14277:3-827(+)